MKISIKNIEFEAIDEHVSWFWPLVNQGKWGEFEFSSILKCPKKDMMWDIGAWNGVTTLFASKFFKKVICWEPDWKSYNHLIENINHNHLENIITNKLGIYSKEDTISLGGGITGHGSSSASIKSSQNNYYQIKTTTIPLSIEKYGLPDFMKIDIEGAEEDILEDIYTSGVNYIFIEIHLHLLTDKNRFLDNFNKMFQKYTILNHNFEETFSIESDNPNYLMIKK